jgi:methylglyoxal synthase
MLSKKEKKGGIATIAFLVSNKSTLRVRQFVESHLEEIQEFNIIATLTEGKELESIKGLKIQYVPSLELGGCNEVAQRVKRYSNN